MSALLLFSKIPMNIKEHLFAKNDLTKAVRFNTALKITSKLFLHKSYNAPVVLFAIMNSIEDYENIELKQPRLTGYQKNAVAGISFSQATSKEIVKAFVDTYNDDKKLLDWLNGFITLKSIPKLGSRDKYSDEEAVVIAKKIINQDLLEALDLSL